MPTLVVALVRIGAVLATMAGLAGHDVAVGKGGLEVLPADHRQRHEAQPAAGVDAGDSLTGGLLPPGLGLPVVHDQVAVVQPPGGAEIQHLVVEAPVEGDRGVAQRAERDRHRLVAELVVDDLVPGENLDRIGAHEPAGLDDRNRLAGLQPAVGVGDRQVLRGVDRGNAVLGRAAGEDLRVGHRVPAEVGAELPGRARWRRLLREQLHAFRRRRHGGRGLATAACERDPGGNQGQAEEDGERHARMGGLKLVHRGLDGPAPGVLTYASRPADGPRLMRAPGNSLYPLLPIMRT